MKVDPPVFECYVRGNTAFVSVSGTNNELHARVPIFMAFGKDSFNICKRMKDALNETFEANNESHKR